MVNIKQSNRIKKIMKPKFLIIFGLAIMLLQVTAFMQPPKEKALLWKLSGNGLEKPSYIFGTIHIIPKTNYFFPEYMSTALKSCETLALEVDISDMGIAKQVAIAKRVMMPEGETIKKYMTDDEYQQYKSFIIDSLEVKKKKFDQMNKVLPLFSSGILINELIKKPVGYEKKLTKLAKKNKMAVIGLETMEFQISIFEGISVEEQVKSVILSSLEKNPLDEYNALVKLYVEQELDSLGQMARGGTLIENFEEKFLIERNRNWIEILKKGMQNKSMFVAVGAAHLAGEQGILDLLEKEGFTVEPVLQ